MSESERDIGQEILDAVLEIKAGGGRHFTPDDHQPYPQTGQLAQKMNLCLDDLRDEIVKDAIVYCYVITTIKNPNGQFYQTGSAPNFQGDFITLCTCKHFMRTFLEPEEWLGKWVAGFSGVAAGYGRNALVYLMNIGHAFDSHQTLWLSPEISDETKEAKATDIHRFGDVYRPKELSYSDLRFDHQSYKPPVEKHPHFDNWLPDISYKRKRKATLLVGEPAQSYLWNRPMVFYTNGRIHRGQKKMVLLNLLEKLEELSE
ncbi:MAG TPA: hypothetical protein PLD25_18350 [Chloroflexota bacterium]|nr:hypothetical protein [Chloroflexota bacterium]HUM68345.1 hypothetical protein [Chloroflexota bacterium]